MSCQYLVKAPYTFMYLENSTKSEVTDQLLYGTSVNILEKNQNGTALCITEYGYKGYVDTSMLEEKDDDITDSFTVTSSFCPLYKYKQCRERPEMVLVRGSRIFAREVSVEEGYTLLNIDGKTYYVRTNHLTRTSGLFHYTSQEQKRRQIVRNALLYLGSPYMWAGKSPSGIDCSGLCFMAYTLSGACIYRDAEPDCRYVRKIPRKKLKPADLIYFNGHVVMYIGENLYVHSSSTFSGVTVNSFDKNSRLYYAELDKKEVCCASSLIFSDR